MAKFVIFLCSVISQGKTVALDRWNGKWNNLSMTHRLITDYAKNYCNRTLIVKVILENVVTFSGDTVYSHIYTVSHKKGPNFETV